MAYDPANTYPHPVLQTLAPQSGAPALPQAGPPNAYPPPVPSAGVQPQANTQAPIPPQMVEMQIQDLASRNPQALAQIKQAVDQAMMSGELTQQELDMMVQLATTVLRNPALYPQIRQFAIQQGLATEQDLSPTYDQGLVIAILIAARAARADVGGQDMMAAQSPGQPLAQPPMQSMQDGGPVGGGASAPVPIQAHTGEYVIPKHVVDMKGREFFDRMLAQYADKARNS